MIDYEDSYNILIKWLDVLDPYCDNCKSSMLSDSDPDYKCDECHRKAIMWELNLDSLPNLTEVTDETET